MKLMSGIQTGQRDLDQPLMIADGLLSGRLHHRGRSLSLPTNTVINVMRQNSLQCTSAPLLDGLGLPLEEQTLVHLLLEKVGFRRIVFIN